MRTFRVSNAQEVGIRSDAKELKFADREDAAVASAAQRLERGRRDHGERQCHHRPRLVAWINGGIGELELLQRVAELFGCRRAVVVVLPVAELDEGGGLVRSLIVGWPRIAFELIGRLGCLGQREGRAGSLGERRSRAD